jgi:integrase
MRGHIRRREGKRGTSWRLWVDLGPDPLTKKRRQYTETHPGPERLAHRRLRDLVEAAEKGDPLGRGPVTVGDHLDGWLTTIGETLRPSTRQSYGDYVRAYLKPPLGAHRLTQLVPETIQAAYDRMLKSGGRGGRPLSRRTVFHAHRVLSEALKHAVRAGLIARNPADRTTPPKPERTEITTVAPDDMRKILDHLKEHAPWAVAPTALALATGLRRSELLALQWGDLLLDATPPALVVRRAYVRLDGGVDAVRPPKSAKGIRTVILTRSAVDILYAHRMAVLSDADLIDREVKPSDWVFADALGTPFKPGSLSQAFRRACRAVGVDGAHLHSLRHTHATVLLRANVHPKIVQERLGHSTVSTTLDTYSHAVAGLQVAAAEAFDKAFEAVSPASLPGAS